MGWPPDKSRDLILMFIQLVSFRIFLSFLSLRIFIWTEKMMWHWEASSCSNRWSFCSNDKYSCCFVKATFSSQWALNSHVWNFTEGSHAQSTCTWSTARKQGSNPSLEMYKQLGRWQDTCDSGSTSARIPGLFPPLLFLQSCSMQTRYTFIKRAHQV